jgi:RNA polymerase sigma-70 factor (ECF subfamily)
MREPAEAARALFDEHGAAVYRFAAVLLRHHQDAEDVAQETFLKLLRHLTAGGDTTNLRGWLFTVAAHAARDRQRRAMRWLPWTAAREPAAPAHPIDEDDRLEVGRAPMQRLAPRDRLLVGLRAQGLSYREIAAAAGIKPSSVGRLLARAVDRWQRAASRRAPIRDGDGDGATTRGGHQKGVDVYELSERRTDSGHRR